MSAKQLKFPGMGKVQRVKTEKPKPVKERKSKLSQELQAGNRPMFMTAGEVIKHANLTDAGTATWIDAGDKKTPRQVSRERRLMEQKLKESKTGTMFDSHRRRYENQDIPSLYESIAKRGLEGSLTLHNSYATALDLYQGHHRLAAMRNLHPKQFIPIEYTEDLEHGR